MGPIERCAFLEYHEAGEKPEEKRGRDTLQLKGARTAIQSPTDRQLARRRERNGLRGGEYKHKKKRKDNITHPTH